MAHADAGRPVPREIVALKFRPRRYGNTTAQISNIIQTFADSEGNCGDRVFSNMNREAGFFGWVLRLVQARQAARQAPPTGPGRQIIPHLSSSW